MPLFFDASKLGAPTYEYVAWVDVMGTQSTMSRSVSAAANFIAKLHTAALLAPRTLTRLYPVMDGFYAACPDQAETLEFLRSLFTQTADEFNQSTKDHHRFMVRGGLAFGPVYHGTSITASASQTLSNNPSHRDSLLMGMPLIQAHLVESQAPPFGLFVHESARAFAPAGQAGLNYSWWRWNQANNQQVWMNLQDQLPKYLEWCEKHSLIIGYSPERIKVHREMVQQFFA